VKLELTAIQPYVADYKITSFQQENDGGLYSVVVESKKKTWPLYLQLGSGFPLQLPSIYLQHPLASHQQHLCWNQEICISDGEGVSTRFDRPELIIAQSLNEAVRIIEEPFNQIEFWDEFEGYWRGYSDNNVELFVNPDQHSASSGVYELGSYKTTKGKLLGFYDHPTKLAQHSFGYKPYKGKSELRSYLVCLTSLSNPPLPKKPWTTSDILASIENGLTKQDLRVLKRKLGKGKSKQTTDIVFRVDRPSGGHNVFACSIKFSARQGLFGELSIEDKVLPFHCERLGSDFLKERGGGIANLNDKTVTIIGCGSIGGYIANMIAQSGIKQLNLVDPDDYKAENLYRHVLPSHKLYGSKGSRKKVILMSEFLRSEFPHIQVNSFPTSYQTWSELGLLKDTDCIVLATGNPSLERAICAELYAREDPIDAVHCWQEGMGLGGHAVSYNTSSNGCLNCLYMKSGNQRLSPLTSFIEEGQNTSKAMGGCIAAFTPFSAVDANQTASIASRMIINALSNSTPCSYNGWKSDQPLPEATAIRKTNFYNDYHALKGNAINALSSSTCNVCNQSVVK
jgi:hypothetical protein